MTPVAAPDGVGVATLPSTADVFAFEEEREPAGARVLRLAHGRLTLDELVSGAWAAIGAGFPAACPVCDGPMSPNGSAPAACGNCSAELS
jgi:DnaJ-class molecular chaperone